MLLYPDKLILKRGGQDGWEPSLYFASYSPLDTVGPWIIPNFSVLSMNLCTPL